MWTSFFDKIYHGISRHKIEIFVMSTDLVHKFPLHTNRRSLERNRNIYLWFVGSPLLSLSLPVDWLCLLQWKTFPFPSNYYQMRPFWLLLFGNDFCSVLLHLLIVYFTSILLSMAFQPDFFSFLRMFISKVHSLILTISNYHDRHYNIKSCQQYLIVPILLVLQHARGLQKAWS